MTPREEARVRAARGAAVLDQIRPGWFQILDPGTIEMSECRRCVLGRLYGTFQEGLLAVSGDGASLPPVPEGVSLTGLASYLGFDVDGSCGLVSNLQEAWVDLIRSRQRGEGGPS